VDGAWEGTIPPYQRCIVLAPENPQAVAEQLAAALGCAAAVIDANDLGGGHLRHFQWQPGSGFLADLMRDNPLGQSTEQTPFGIIRLGSEERSDTGYSAS